MPNPLCDLDAAIARYFVDERNGCIAVRDSQLTDPTYPGLHEDTTGVVRFWIGFNGTDTCPTCGSVISLGWHVRECDREEAKELCERLNTASPSRAAAETEGLT